MAAEPIIEAVSGAVGAVISLTATYPLITVVTLRALDTEADGSGGRRLPGALGHLPTAVQEVILHARNRGWRSLYAGLKPSVVATAASQGVYFYFYSMLRGWAVSARVASLRRQRRAARAMGAAPPEPDADAHSGAIGVGASLLVAAAAGCINVCLTIPMWVVITQMQAAQRQAKPAPQAAAVLADGAASGGEASGAGAAGQEAAGAAGGGSGEVAVSRAEGGDCCGGGGGERPGTGAWATASRLYRDQGIGAFYRGLWPSLVMVSNPTIQFVLYEWLASRLRDLRRPAAAALGRKPRLSTADVFLVSAAAKVGATLATYPMLVVKSRMQAVNRDTAEGQRYTSVPDAVRRMAATEGVAAFYRGMRVKLAQTVLAAALMMALKEAVYDATHAALAGAGAGAGGRKAAARPAAARPAAARR
ncbi:peroxisomal nicotinamide adenine dinucleotide carrier protein [Raphidocelis subcapitata]|uniref:Peroxisomal nicotinamide adenine dinucleotide carrier protein n=1 Tax=Raphidocelis subcapitata TaxID=307507 RepID=A0A2V0NV18_9CHLO|nr:peroxisomal nicotinamide adenine dinucleotide carrier protein [Raphidocelis subcapitata]|eukprot:GBF90522.1 peroxisomal nicotinamide adenine dinucleotide carrier protein [Raphidocelis subcapitata]